MIKRRIFPGVKDILEKLHRQGYPMYIVSGGGTDRDLGRMARKVGVAHYFKGIFGFGQGAFASFGKSENFKRVAKTEDEKDPAHYVFIGDSESDYKLSQSVGSKFLGIPNKWNKWKDKTEMQKILVYNINKLPLFLV